MTSTTYLNTTSPSTEYTNDIIPVIIWFGLSQDWPLPWFNKWRFILPSSYIFRWTLVSHITSTLQQILYII